MPAISTPIPAADLEVAAAEEEAADAAEAEDEAALEVDDEMEAITLLVAEPVGTVVLKVEASEYADDPMAVLTVPLAVMFPHKAFCKLKAAACSAVVQLAARQF